MTLKVHHLRPAPGAHKSKMRVGRGEGSKGKTAGRGTKGTKARYQVAARFEGGQMPLALEGGEVTVDDLVATGAVRKRQLVKVLGSGELTVALAVSVHAFSDS